MTRTCTVMSKLTDNNITYDKYFFPKIKPEKPSAHFDVLTRDVITGRYFCFDQVRFWTKRRLTNAERDSIKAHSGGFRPNHVKREHYAFMQSLGWRQSHALFQPTNGTFRMLDKSFGDDVLINYIEPRLELVSDYDEDTQDLYRFLERHQWQGHRSKNEQSTDYYGTIYSGYRARNEYVIYADRPSKITGEVHCVAVEWRTSGKGACAEKGIRTFADLIAFDHLAFWKSRLKLARIDMLKLELDCQNVGRRVMLRRPRHEYRPYARAHLLCRIACYDGLADNAAYKELGAFQDIKAGWNFGQFRFHKYVQPIPNSGLLGL